MASGSAAAETLQILAHTEEMIAALQAASKRLAAIAAALGSDSASTAIATAAEQTATEATPATFAQTLITKLQNLKSCDPATK